MRTAATELVRRAVRQLETIYQGGCVEIKARPSTGLAPLDRLTAGLPLMTAIGLTGPSGAGARSLCAAVSLHFLRTRGAVAWVSVSLSAEELMARFLLTVANANLDRLYAGTLTVVEWSRLLTAATDLSALPFHIIEGRIAPEEVVTMARKIPGLALLVTEVSLPSPRQAAAAVEAAVIGLGEWCARAERSAFDAVLDMQRENDRVRLSVVSRRNGPLGSAALRFHELTLAFSWEDGD